MIQDVTIPKSAAALADNTTLEASGGKLQIKNDGVGYAKLNADIVGIDTTTGKVNTINSTNFKSLDGSNLIDVGFTKLAQITADGTSTTLDTGTIATSGYTMLLITFSGKSENAGEEQSLEMWLNDDNAGGTYSYKQGQLGAGTGSTADNQNKIDIGQITRDTADANTILTGLINLGTQKGGFINNATTNVEGYSTSWGWETASTEITKITIETTASQFKTGGVLTVYGIS